LKNQAYLLRSQAASAAIKFTLDKSQLEQPKVAPSPAEIEIRKKQDAIALLH